MLLAGDKTHIINTIRNRIKDDFYYPKYKGWSIVMQYDDIYKCILNNFDQSKTILKQNSVCLKKLSEITGSNEDKTTFCLMIV
jgi:hypothetical protein